MLKERGMKAAVVYPRTTMASLTNEERVWKKFTSHKVQDNQTHLVKLRPISLTYALFKPSYMLISGCLRKHINDRQLFPQYQHDSLAEDQPQLLSFEFSRVPYHIMMDADTYTALDCYDRCCDKGIPLGFTI